MSPEPNLDSKDSYEILGVSRNDDDTVIKKAYKKLALKYHPDKNPDNRENSERSFKKISEAYDCISTAERRGEYNRASVSFQHHPFAHHGHAGHFTGHEARDLFEQVFGTNDPFRIFDDFPRGDLFERRRSSGPFPGMSGFGSFGMFGSSPFSLFDDGGFGSFQSSSMSFGGGANQSISSSTSFINGQRVTTTTRTVANPDGSQTTTVTREDGRGQTTETYIEDGGRGGRAEQIQIQRGSSRTSRKGSRR
eukprot:Selendium_serpulae@DN6349_c0_g1_i1.p2